MLVNQDNKITTLQAYNVLKGQSSVSGLSSGAFMTVQLHLAHSASFIGAGVIAGGPFRCAESFRHAALLAEDAWLQNALYICMNPLVPFMAPSVAPLIRLTRQSAASGEIDPLDHLSDQRLYIFTGRADSVVFSDTVRRTREFYQQLGVPQENILFRSDLQAGHSIITDNPEDSPLAANQPPYINNGGFMQSHEILKHIYGPLHPPAERLSGHLLRFDQREFFDDSPRASMSQYGYAYIPQRVLEGAPARVHIALHGCKQGYNYVNYVNGRADVENSVPYGNRYFTTTGYNQMADSNDLIILYPQAEGIDDGTTQNPDGCWDWWGYTCTDAEHTDYYSKQAIQIRAIHGMLTRLGG